MSTTRKTVKIATGATAEDANGLAGAGGLVHAKTTTEDKMNN